MKTESDCKHEWRYQYTDELREEYYYCVHCLSRAVVDRRNVPFERKIFDLFDEKVI